MPAWPNAGAVFLIFSAKDTVEDIPGTSPGEKRRLRDWIDPLQLYDLRVAAGRLVFLWGLAIFPLVVMFVVLTPIMIVAETVFPNFNPDAIGLSVWRFMLAWVMATAATTGAGGSSWEGRKTGFGWLASRSLTRLFSHTQPQADRCLDCRRTFGSNPHGSFLCRFVGRAIGALPIRQRYRQGRY